MMNNIEGQISFFDTSIKDSHKFKVGDNVLFKYGWNLDEKGKPRNFIVQGIVKDMSNHFCTVEFEYRGEHIETGVANILLHKVIE